MAYKDFKNINWCPNCKIGLSNEEASGGVCERCGSKVVQKEKEQWMLRMRDYSEDLLKGLDDTLFEDRIKVAQRNWIGKSTGATIRFKLNNIKDFVEVFTTRADTIYGVTFLVLAPENPLLLKYKDRINNYQEIEEYRDKVTALNEFTRSNLNKDKSGLLVEGLSAVNPITEEEVPIYVASYVLMNYGTGAIMAVPAHDDRDLDFAKLHDLKILPVIKNDSYINSPLIEGLSKEKAIDKVISYLDDKDLGFRTTNYKLQDWVFSRQRFWGEPIPIIKCPKCGYVPIASTDLPVKLPDVASYDVTLDGESPLAKIDSWVNVKCPICGSNATRETDTMPNWAGSSWYYLRYMDPNNDKEFVNYDKAKYWGQVDFYNGGMEHATRHLLYARFWNQFLYNIGLVPNKEPFLKRVSQGMVLADDGTKMSKSKGNIITPDSIVEEYGADTLRLYEMFMGDYQKDVMWNTDSLLGCKKFLDRVIRNLDKVKEDGKTNKKLLHKTIKKVTEDIDNLKFNTAVSSLMILLNEFETFDSIGKESYEIFLKLLYPFCPHLSEELNERLANSPISKSTWPTYKEEFLKDDTKTIGVQVNGKLRDEITVSSDEDKADIEKKVLELDGVKKHIKDKEIIKIIIIPAKIVNIVVK